ncbi:MAG TPA: helix-turn-helix transcriptional regulator [Candidatus Binataceae bacterium]
MKAKVNADAVRLLDSLAGRRKALRMSLRAVAERSGLGLRTVQRVLSLRDPSAKLATVIQIAEALKVELRPREAGSARGAQESGRLEGRAPGLDGSGNFGFGGASHSKA